MIVRGEEFVCKYCGKNCGNNSSNFKVHKNECKHGKVDKLPLLFYECDSCKHKFTNRFNLNQHIASSPHCRTKIEQLQKGKSSMASNNRQKTDSVSDSSKSSTRHNDWTGKQKLTFGTTVDTEKVKEYSLCHPKAQTTELVKQSKAKIKRTESGKQSSQSESLCEQENTDLQATTKGDEYHHSTTQSTNFVVKARCEYCDKPFNSITNHRKHLKVCAETTDDCKICGKTFTSVKQFQNHK